MTELNVFRGDDKTWTLTFVDSAAVAYDITGATIFFTCKIDKKDADASAIITKDITSHSNASGGISALTLTATQTDIKPGNYWYDLQLVESGGTVSTFLSGKFVVKQDVTTRVA